LEVFVAMPCSHCASDNQKEFGVEMNVHFPGYKGLSRPTLMIFPQVLVCLNCGFAEFSVPEADLRRLVMSNGASG
jgi:hypothetical protein